MRKFYAFLVTWLVGLAAVAQSLPEFSTEDSPVWYSVQFKSGSARLAEQGAGKMLVTSSTSNADSVKWQFIGSADNFVMKSKRGNYVYYTSSRFYAGTTSSNLKLVTSPSDEDYWEIQLASNSSQSMNQWGGTGTGKNLGLWTAGDANNLLSFAAMSLKEPVWSTLDSSSEQYYFIQFANSSMTLADQGLGEAVRTSNPEPTDAQLWKFVGNASNFQLINKLGHYAFSSSTAAGGASYPLRTQETEYEGGFCLAESQSSTYAPAWMIQSNNLSGQGYFNQWGGTSAGRVIGLWTSASDNNNAILFVTPDDMSYADYKSTGISGFVPENKLTLWYTEPATTATLYSGGTGYSNWMEYSLPLGNGQFGASIFGGIQKDEIQFNEKTLWSGKSTDNGSEYGDYENFGSVYAEDLTGLFDYTSAGGATNYYRLLDLTTATARTSFATPDQATTFTREYIASNPDGVVAAHYTASEGGKISLRFTLASGKPGVKATTSYADGQATFAGSLETVSYNARIKVVPTGGTMTTGDDGITVIGADEVLLVLAGATDFDATSSTYVSNTANIASEVQAIVNDAAAKGWTSLYDAHVADHKSFFDRVNLDLANTSNTVPTNELIDNYSGGNGADALMLEQLYFAYGRYLEIGSSRGVDLPSNLQGIWNNMSEPAWNSDIHANINVQMNYWPAEPTNLSEMHVPFLNYIINMAESAQWKNYATAAGQSRGWTCYTENNIFGGVGSFLHAYVVANAWYVSHLWQHYRYTLDRDFLKRAFPAMLTASQFWLDRLVLASDGTYEAPNEYSPEHGPTQNAVAHAQQIVYECLYDTKQALDILGSDAEITDADVELLNDRLAKMDKGLAKEEYTGDWGTSVISSGDSILREWKYSTFTAGANGHRHMSHLMCVYPFNQVTPSSPYFQAAVNSMLLRGDGATGWSMGWKINLWARVGDGNHARTILNNALGHSNGGAGVFYNLYDSHAPFQIDGNFGACAGMAEMLLQSHTDTIQILPALPSAWKAGTVKGLKAIGDFTVDITWASNKAETVKVVSNQGQKAVIALANVAKAQITLNGTAIKPAAVGTDIVTIETSAGDVIDIDLTQVPEEESAYTGYVIKNARSNRYAVGQSTGSTTLQSDFPTTNGQWVFYQDNDGVFTEVNPAEATSEITVKIFNAGLQKYLQTSNGSSTSWTTDSTAANNWYIAPTTQTSGSESYTGFYISADQGGTTQNCWNGYGGTSATYIGYWSVDVGSVFTFSIFDEDAEILESLKPFATVLSVDLPSLSEIKANPDFATQKAALFTKASANYYRLNCTTRSKALGVNASSLPAGVDASASDIDQLWQIIPSGEGFNLAQANRLAGGLSAYLPAMQGGNPAPAAEFTDASSAQVWEFANISTSEGTFKLKSISSSAANQYINMESAGYSSGDYILDGWNTTIFAAEKVTTVDIDIPSTTDGCLATGYFPFAVKAPETVKAYVGSTLEGENLTIVPATAVAAENGVIFEAPSAGTYTLSIASTDDTPATSTISGTTVEESVTDGKLIFTIGGSSHKAGFFSPSASTTVLQANRAYYVNGSLNAVYIKFSGTTGINSLEAEGEDNGPVYDIAGRRVAAPQKGGIYVKAGRKIIK